MEIQNGTVEIDGFDISHLELDVLRSRLALVPQDSAMFLGTLRENLYFVHCLLWEHMLMIRLVTPSVYAQTQS